MDQELIAYLDTRFSAIDERFSNIDKRFSDMDKRFSAMNERFSKIDERFSVMDKRFSDMDDRMGGLEEAIRHTDIKVEDLRGTIQLVAEGVTSVNQKLDAFRVEVAREFQEVKTQNLSSYAQLDRRVSKLEQRAQAS